MTQPDNNYFVHESAYVDAPCQIGDGTKIWHYSHVCADATIGAGCNLGQNVFVAGGVVMGNNVKIQNNVSVYSGVVLEDDVFLGPSCVLTNISNPRSQVIRRGVYEKTRIKRGATVGANATIVCGVTIGQYALIAAGAVVTGDVADYAMIMGVPGRQNGWVSRHGIPLPLPDAAGIMICPESGFRYQFEDGTVRCLDIDEDRKLPEKNAIGMKEYRNYKPKKND
ncbi:MAG: acyltransferase [Planctomycetota bacterium]|jgi:UDP-2-acetamido-3-amino-2,3-dideoxy-glucuronate N-acetyltransferase